MTMKVAGFKRFTDTNFALFEIGYQITLKVGWGGLSAL